MAGVSFTTGAGGTAAATSGRGAGTTGRGAATGAEETGAGTAGVIHDGLNSLDALGLNENDFAVGFMSPFLVSSGVNADFVKGFE